MRLMSLSGVYSKTESLIEKLKAVDVNTDDEESKENDIISNLRDFIPSEKDILTTLTSEESYKYFKSGHNLLAVSADLSINNFSEAYMKLIRSGEYFFAYQLSELLFKEGFPLVKLLLADINERFGDFNRAHRLLKESSQPTRAQFLEQPKKMDEVNLNEM